MVRASDVHEEKETNEMTVVVMTDAIVDPRTVMICIACETCLDCIELQCLPMRSTHLPQALEIEMSMHASSHAPSALAAMVCPRRFVRIASSTVPWTSS